MQELGRALRQIAFRLQLIEKEQRRCKITLQELGSMPVSTPMYKAAGEIPPFMTIVYLLLTNTMQVGRK